MMGDRRYNQKEVSVPKGKNIALKAPFNFAENLNEPKSLYEHFNKMAFGTQYKPSSKRKGKSIPTLSVSPTNK